MDFGGFQKLTVLDYPGHVACTLFTRGCNFRCPFCHNAILVESGDDTVFYEEEILAFLTKRSGVMDGVCITGGEPLLHKGLPEFLKKVKGLGYDVKVDTNGSFPEMLKELVSGGLVDYVAMDIKNSPDKYDKTADVAVDFAKIEESINFLMNSGVDYEFRTTVVAELHTPQDIGVIAQKISGAKRYFLQNFVDSGHILGENMTPVSDNVLREMGEIAEKFVGYVKIR